MKKNKQQYEDDYGFLLIKAENKHGGLIKTIEDISNNKPYSQICIFNSSLSNLVIDKLPVFHMNEAKFFFGNLFIFDIASLILTKDYPNIITRYFYAFNCPWVDNGVATYKEWKNIFGHSNLEIIAQNQIIADMYEICWKKPVLVAEEFSYESISKIFK